MCNSIIIEPIKVRLAVGPWSKNTIAYNTYEHIRNQVKEYEFRETLDDLQDNS